MYIDLTQLRTSPPLAAADFLGRLARWMEPPTGQAPEPALPAEEPTLPTALTPGMLRAALLEMGVAAGAQNIQLAEAFSQLGVPLTPSSLTQAHVALANAPGVAPLSYAFAQSLGLTPTPDILRALSSITGGIPAQRDVPPEIREWLGLALDTGLEPEALAAQLHMMVGQRAHSTEGRLLTVGEETSPIHDARSLLLRLAQNAGDRQTRIGADTLASHIEGQQLINLAAQREHAGPGQPPLYFALPMQFPAEQTMLEMRLWCQDTPEEREDNLDAVYLQATVRVATTRLGRVQADLAATLGGSLECRLGADQPATLRLLQRFRDKLAASLCDTGWPQCQVTCRAQADWKPLWHGGEALTSPRTRVDWKA